MNRKIKRAFKGCVDRCKERKIEFQFTLDEWIKWWKLHLGPNWLRKRGRLRGQYVMARRNDRGPYASWNVECKLVQDNHTDRKKNGVSTAGIKHWQAKLTNEQVQEIYLALGSESMIGRKYGVHAATIGDIKRRTTWAHITTDLGPSPRLPAKRKGRPYKELLDQIRLHFLE